VGVGVIQITPQMRILVAVEAVDFRNGIDGLARVCKQQLQADPFSGGLFVFRNRRRTAIKILAYDGQGFWLCQKRLSTGRFRFWPASATEGTQGVAAHQLQVLLMGGDPTSAKDVRSRCVHRHGSALRESLPGDLPRRAPARMRAQQLQLRSPQPQ
jgi:transposase